MCRVLRVARSGWYVWQQRGHQPGPQQQFLLTCDAAVRKAFTEAKQRYGRHASLINCRSTICHQGLRAKVSRWSSQVSYREHGLPVSENLLKQDFCACGPNRKWADDITYLRTDESWLYLTVVIDLWSRAIIGWSMSSRMTVQLACDALQMALWRRRSPENVSFTPTMGSSIQQVDLIKCNVLFR